MRFGLFTSMGAQTWSGVLDLWRHIEATGWDIACVTDHFIPNTKEREGAMLEAWSTLSALSALVPRMRVGTIVLGNTYRHPAVVAKMAAQVDIISGGRLLLGLGAGWQENEHAAYGIPFYTMRERLERLDEACQVIKSLWTERRATFKGRYYQLSEAPLEVSLHLGKLEAKHLRVHGERVRAVESAIHSLIDDRARGRRLLADGAHGSLENLSLLPNHAQC